MKKGKLIKKYEQYMIDYELAKDVFDYETKTNKVTIDEAFRIHYEKMFFNHMLMMDVVSEKSVITENYDIFLAALKNNEFEKDSLSFLHSMNKSRRLYYLTPYELSELDNFDLYKIKGYDIGFAIKKDGDIILVHNNSHISGIGDILIQKAIEMGGNHLDHFDGFLTGFYRKNNFKLKYNDEFQDCYAPQSWTYDKVDIDNPKTSIYVDELEVDEEKYLDAKDRYTSGRPDIVYRVLKK
jgi:hypothetical protein